MKTFLLTATYAVGIGELILAIYFWVTNSKNEIRRVMALLAFSTAVWVIFSGLTSYHSYTLFGYYENAIVYLFGAFVVLSLLHLSLITPYKLFALDRLHVFLLYLPLAFFTYMLFFSRTIVFTFNGSQNDVGNIFGGPLLGMYNTYLLSLFLCTLGIFIYRIRHSDGIHRKNSILVFLSVILGGLPGAVLYLLIATVTPHLPVNTLIGVIPTGIWIGLTSYILLRKQ